MVLAERGQGGREVAQRRARDDQRREHIQGTQGRQRARELLDETLRRLALALILIAGLGEPGRERVMPRLRAGRPVASAVGARRVSTGRAQRSGESDRIGAAERALLLERASATSRRGIRSRGRNARNPCTSASRRAPAAVPVQGRPPRATSGSCPPGHGIRCRRSVMRATQGSRRGASTAMSPSGTPARTCCATQSAAACTSSSTPACSSSATEPSGPVLRDRSAAPSAAGSANRPVRIRSSSRGPAMALAGALASARACAPKSSKSRSSQRRSAGGWAQSARVAPESDERNRASAALS